MYNSESRMDPETPPQKSQPLSSSTPHIFQTPVNPPPKLTSSKTCLPRPLFHEEPETFSTKKQRREGGLFRPPPHMWRRRAQLAVFQRWRRVLLLIGLW